jgi:histone H3/H4
MLRLTCCLDKILQEIRILQKSTDLLISRQSFQKLIKELVSNCNTIMNISMKELRMQKSALDALQKTAENFLIENFESKINSEFSD